MSCPKNIKKFLWWKYEGPHDWKVIFLDKFMESSSNFQTIDKCAICHAKRTRHFVEEETLIREGITVAELNHAERDGFFIRRNTDVQSELEEHGL